MGSTFSSGKAHAPVAPAAGGFSVAVSLEFKLLAHLGPLAIYHSQ